MLPVRTRQDVRIRNPVLKKATWGWPRRTIFRRCAVSS
jgi:hypothetical protein